MECDAKIENLVIPQLTDDQIRELYDDYVALKPCLEKLGYEIRSEPPSIDTFVETYNTGHSWSPYNSWSTISARTNGKPSTMSVPQP